jgi:hypothetical protein
LLVYCWDGAITSLSCADLGYLCVWRGSVYGYACAPEAVGEPESDPSGEFPRECPVGDSAE